MLRKSLFLIFIIPCVALRLAEVSESEEPAGSCTLEFMRSKIYMFAMLRTSEIVLSENFLNHYMSLGIHMTSHLHLLVHTETEGGLEEMQDMFQRIGVRPQIETTANYSSDLKRTFVNNWLKTLPEDAWVVYPDADEFFSYPCWIQHAIQQGYDDFSARMADRIGINFTIEEMQVSTNLHNLNPMKCPNMREHFGGACRKQILFKAYGPNNKPRQMGSSHYAMSGFFAPAGTDFVKGSPMIPAMELVGESLYDFPNNATVPSYDTGVFFDHYFWTTKTMKEIAEKKSLYGEHDIRSPVYNALFEIIDGTTGGLTPKGLEIFAQYCHYDNDE